MALESHKGQILPLGNQLIPISKNTVFHANYDNDLYGFNQGQRISPCGYTKVLSFDDTDDYIRVDGAAKLITTGNDFTFMCWFKTNNSPGVIHGNVIFSAHDASGNTNIWRIGTSTGGGIFYSGSADQSNGSGYADNKWHHLAATVLGSNGTPHVYVDGVEITGFTGTQIPWSSAVTMSIGQEWDGAVASDFFSGQLSDVRIYKQVLTIDQIKGAMYTEGTGNESNLIGYWKLNEGTGSVVYDSSPYGNDGLIYGGAVWAEGRTVATIRPDGKFNKGVGVDQDTVNLITNPVTPETWSNLADPAYGSISVSYIDTDLGTRGIERVTSGINDYRGDRIDIAFPSELSVTQPHTFSVYARADSPNTQLQLNIEGKDASNVRTDFNTTIGLSTEWKRYAVTFTLNTVGMVQTNMYKYVKLYCVATDGNKHAYQLTMPQLEQKAFSTSFIYGSRGAGSLTYPISVDPNQMTINFWAKSNGGTTYPFYFDINTTEPVSNDDRIYLRPSNNTTLGGGKVVGGTVTALTESTISDAREWNMYTIMISGTTMKVYQNANLITQSITMPQVASTNIRMSLATQNAAYSVIYDDIRIDRVAVSEEEIVSWYYGNSPFYNYLDYTGVGY